MYKCPVLSSLSEHCSEQWCCPLCVRQSALPASSHAQELKAVGRGTQTAGRCQSHPQGPRQCLLEAGGEGVEYLLWQLSDMWMKELLTWNFTQYFTYVSSFSTLFAKKEALRSLSCWSEAPLADWSSLRQVLISKAPWSLKYIWKSGQGTVYQQPGISLHLSDICQICFFKFSFQFLWISKLFQPSILNQVWVRLPRMHQSICGEYIKGRTTCLRTRQQ